jgi:DNA-binding beta-propeller fold protein YncE
VRFIIPSQRRETTVLRVAFFFAVLLHASGVHPQLIDMEELKSEEFFRWGVEAYHGSYFNNAIQSFERALSFKPNNTLARIWLGKAFYKSGLEEQALHEWNYLVENKKSTAVLNNWIKFVSYRRSLGPELNEEGEDRYVISFEIDGNGADYYRFKRPTAVRACPDGSIYVVAFASNEILRIDANTRVVDVFNGGLESYNHPYDVLEVDHRYLFITEFAGNRILKCDLAGNKIHAFGGKGTGPGELLGPQYLSNDINGYIFVTDYGNRRVSKYDYEGNYILSFGRGLGAFPGFLAPTGIAVLDDRVFVADRERQMIYVFDVSGNYLTSIGKGLLEAPETIHISGNRSLIVADTSRLLEIDIEDDTVKVRSDVGTYARRIVGTTIDANNDIVAVDFDLNRIFFLSPMSSLYTGYFVKIERVDAQKFPEVTVDISVINKEGNPLVGLKQENFRISESARSVEKPELILTNDDPSKANIVILVEKSFEAGKQAQAFEEAAASIYELFNEKAQIKIVSACKEPTVETDYGETRLRMMQAVKKNNYSADWKFDQSVRVAASQLFPTRGKKAIVFLSQGGLGSDPYRDYSLMELAQFLRNNAIAFNSIYLSNTKPNPDIHYLCQNTDGQDIFFYNPLGVTPLEDRLTRRITPVYVLKYISPSYAEFGRRYISLEAEVTLKSKSGYDTSGFYAPLEF